MSEQIVEKSTADISVYRELFQRDSDAQTALLWELARDASELASPIEFNSTTFPNDVQCELCDVMLAEVKRLGHIDKVPRSYDWEDLLPTLRPNEELLWIVRKAKSASDFKLYIGVKYNRNDLGSPEALRAREERFQILVNSFAKCLFPESEVQRIYNCHDYLTDKRRDTVGDVLNKLRSATRSEDLTVSEQMKAIYCISGMPSPKDLEIDRIVADRKEENRSFLSLNDAIEPHLYTDSAFTVVFSVSSASASDIRESFNEKFQLRNAIKPFLDSEIAFSENLTTGDAISITPEHETTSETAATKRGLAPELWKSLKYWRSTYKATPSNTTNKMPELKSRSSHSDINRGKSQTIHISRSDLKFVDEHLDKELRHLQQTLGAGGYYATAMVYAEKGYIGESIARSIRATLSGSHSYLAPLKIIQFDSAGFFHLCCNRPVASILHELGARPLVLNRDNACLALLLPDADLPGCSLKKSVFYARPKPAERVTYESGKTISPMISFGTGAYYDGGITEPALLSAGYEDTFDFVIPESDIFSHTFIVGAPGGGKSKRAGYILNHVPGDVRLVVLETAKREYAEVLHRPDRKLVRYTLGNSNDYPFRINPFFFDPGTGLKQHIAVLADAIADLLPMEALIGPKLREAVERCYRRCGWDIETGELLALADNASPRYPDMLMFNSEVAKVCEGLSDYGPEVRSNYTGALKNRASIFIDDIYQDIFAFDGNKPLDELFPPDADVVIEMEDMPPSEINMPAFIISIVLQRLRAYRFLWNRKAERLEDPAKKKEAGKANRFVIAIEEAHNVLSRKIEQSGGDERQSGKGAHLLSQVLRLLAEGRGLGLGMVIIDQAAHAIAPSVLADTNTKVVLRLEDGEEIKTIGTSIGIDEKDWPDLQRLATGECIVKTKASPVPVKLAPLKIEVGTPAVVPEGVPERLLRPTYILAEGFLDEIRSRGLLSRMETEALGRGFVRLVSPFAIQGDLIRYIWGRHLFRMNCLELLDEHLDYPESPMPCEMTARYYALFFRRIMSDGDVDMFLSLALEHSDTSLTADLDELRSLKAGAAKVLRVLKDDCADFGYAEVFSEFSDNLKSVGSIADFTDFLTKFVSAVNSPPPVQYEWRAICEHLYPYWAKKAPSRSIAYLLAKYGIEEGDI